ncbi:hypothetical protein F2Q70_00024971 [Brassica cretica]|uniref:Uncharacterized protein n=1 Tax=Brassica cretica TaxID=69181 RepID=A0A8S9L121_BRACR|nr:hypothetical protein F2Q70_00024971 [Brassica cretica]
MVQVQEEEEEEKREAIIPCSNLRLFFAFVKMVSEEDYRRVLEEYGDLKKDVANGVKEVINLRWSNACLRHKGQAKKLMRRGMQLYRVQIVSEEDYRRVSEEYGDLKKDVANGVKEMINLRWSNACLRHKGRSTKLEERCFGRHSLMVEPEEEQMFHSRRSCSSV